MLSDREFLQRFDAGTLDPASFDHEAHVRAAWSCLRESPFRDAVGRLRRGLKRLAISAGQPQRYHETITVAYARLIERRMQLLGTATWEEFRAQSVDLLAPDLGALRPLYAQDVLDAPESRRTFVPPAAWSAGPVDHLLREFAAYQEELDERPPSALPGEEASGQPGPPGPDDPDRTAPEPVCVTAVLAVADVERSVKWYADAFGFDAAPFPQRPPYQFALLSRGGAELMLRAAARPEDVHPTAGWALYVRLSGGQIRQLYAQLAEAHEIVRPLQRMPYRDVEFEVRDPDGYIVVVSEWLDGE